MTSHLFNDDMFAVIVQPDRHFRGETKLPERDMGLGANRRPVILINH